MIDIPAIAPLKAREPLLSLQQHYWVKCNNMDQRSFPERHPTL